MTSNNSIKVNPAVDLLVFLSVFKTENKSLLGVTREGLLLLNRLTGNTRPENSLPGKAFIDFINTLYTTTKKEKPVPQCGTGFSFVLTNL